MSLWLFSLCYLGFLGTGVPKGRGGRFTLSRAYDQVPYEKGDNEGNKLDLPVLVDKFGDLHKNVQA